MDGLAALHAELVEHRRPARPTPTTRTSTATSSARLERDGRVGGRAAPHRPLPQRSGRATTSGCGVAAPSATASAAALALQAALLDRAERDKGLILPGYTHLQRGQPVLLSHHWLAYVEMLGRDVGRLEDCFDRMDVMTLGAGALAGSPYPLDREYAASLLGFSRVSANSMDAVADRDFVVEHLSALALLAVHLSRLAEELILWSSAEFGFVEMDDAYATGSSIMPQKKNSDVAELVRGKAGTAIGTLVQMLVTLKGLPLTYNKDMQEDKVGVLPGRRRRPRPASSCPPR